MLLFEFLIRGPAAFRDPLGAQVGVVAVAGGRISRPALWPGVGGDALTDPGDVQCGVEERGETILLGQDRP